MKQKPLRWHYGPVSMGAGGTFDANYLHPPDYAPVRVSVINAELNSGTQTGVVKFSLIGDGGRVVLLDTVAITADDTAAAVYPDTVLLGGEGIRVSFSSVTAGDVCLASAWGEVAGR